MIDSKDLLNYLCDENDYRFFAGCPDNGLETFVKCMSSDQLHYIPTVNTKLALGLSLGVSFTGFKSVVMLDIKDVVLIYNYIRDLNTKYKQPLLFLVNYDDENYLSDIKRILKGIKTSVLGKEYKKQLNKYKNEMRFVFVNNGDLI